MKYEYRRKKATESFDSIAFVPHTRVELVIYCVRGSCPGPLDECGVPFVVISLSKSGAKIRLFFYLASFCLKVFFLCVFLCWYSECCVCIFFIAKVWMAAQKIENWKLKIKNWLPQPDDSPFFDCLIACLLEGLRVWGSEWLPKTLKP